MNMIKCAIMCGIIISFLSAPILAANNLNQQSQSSIEMIERLKKDEYKQLVQQTRQFDDRDMMTREIRRLNALLVDLRVERDEWRSKAIELESQQNRNYEQEAREILESHLLLLTIFEEFVSTKQLEMPTELQMLKSDIEIELAKIEQKVN